VNRSLAGRAVLVAGCRGTLGESLCGFFLDRGARVVGCSRSETAVARANFHHYVCDIADEQAVVGMFHLMDRAEMLPDTLILNAAASATALVVMVSDAEIERVLATNLKGASFVVREAFKRMTRKRFGRIIALSSIRVSNPARGSALYAMSKAGLEQLIRVLPFEVSDSDITFNAVEISLLENGMARDLSEQARARLIESLAIKRLCTPADVCNAVEFFARPESSYVTGQVLKLGFV
jgi:3-oxoacyl-[acyl-carrier protein] reductase